MPEEQTFSDLPSPYWDASEIRIETDEVSNLIYSEYFFYGLQIGQYDRKEARAILYP
jgi:hypothetical protein